MSFPAHATSCFQDEHPQQRRRIPEASDRCTLSVSEPASEMRVRLDFVSPTRKLPTATGHPTRRERAAAAARLVSDGHELRIARADGEQEGHIGSIR